MEQSTFKTNPIFSIGLPILITAALLVAYFVVKDLPPWILFLLIVPVVFFVTGLKNKIVIADGHLRYEKVFGKQEVPLNKVAQIVMREVETIVDTRSSPNDNSMRTNRHGHNQPINQERKVEKLYYILDDSGRTFFSFPARLISFNNRQSFEDAVRAVNPNIEVF